MVPVSLGLNVYHIEYLKYLRAWRCAVIHSNNHLTTCQLVLLLNKTQLNRDPVTLWSIWPSRLHLEGDGSDPAALCVPTALTGSLLPPPGPGGGSLPPSDRCSRPRAQRRRPGRSGRWFTTEEARGPEGHAAALPAPLRAAEERQPHLSLASSGEECIMTSRIHKTRLWKWFKRMSYSLRVKILPELG